MDVVESMSVFKDKQMKNCYESLKAIKFLQSGGEKWGEETLASLERFESSRVEVI